MSRLLSTLFAQNSQPPGLLLIGIGLGLVLTSQLFSVIPLAAAMMLIGWGATQILATGDRSQLLLFTNLAVYATLGCFAIAAQSHTAIHGPTGQISLLLWADHGIAVLLLIATAKQALAHFDLPAASDR